MTVSNINNSLFTALSAVNGRTLSTLSHVNGQQIVALTTAFITGFTPGTLRSNFTGTLGMRVRLDAGLSKTVYSLGRWKVAGNTGTHTVSLFDNSEALIEAVSIDTTLGTNGTFQYVNLVTPRVLTSGNSYYIASAETNGGDQWYEQQSVSIQSGVIDPSNGLFAVFKTTGAFSLQTQNFCYVPVNFLYA